MAGGFFHLVLPVGESRGYCYLEGRGADRSLGHSCQLRARQSLPNGVSAYPNIWINNSVGRRSRGADQIVRGASSHTMWPERRVRGQSGDTRMRSWNTRQAGRDEHVYSIPTFIPYSVPSQAGRTGAYLFHSGALLKAHWHAIQMGFLHSPDMVALHILYQHDLFYPIQHVWRFTHQSGSLVTQTVFL